MKKGTAPFTPKRLRKKLPPLSDLVPTTWLDSLLTGPDRVIAEGFEFTAKDIERLLLAVKGRIQEEEKRRGL